MFQTAEALLADPASARIPVDGRLPVCVTVRRRYGAALFLGARSDGGLQYFCVRGEFRDDRWSATDADVDAWLTRPTAGETAPVLLAGLVAESDGETTWVTAPGIAAAGVPAIRAEMGGVEDEFEPDAVTGAFVIVIEAPGAPSTMAVDGGGAKLIAHVSG